MIQLPRAPGAKRAIRPATPADYSLFAKLFPDLGTGDPIPDRERWAKEIEPATLILEDETGKGAGFAFTEILKGVGYVRQIVLDPSQRRRGLGRALMLAVAKQLRAARCEVWCLNVKPDNAAGLALYQGLGMVPQYRSTALRFRWSLVAALPRAPDAVVRAVTPEDDVPLEQTLGLPAGQIALGRAQGRVIRAVVDRAQGTEFAGVAVFNPSFPGAFPFRVTRPELASALLVELEPHALPEPPYMQVVVENDPELVRIMLDQGATVRLEVIHLRGAAVPQDD